MAGTRGGKAEIGPGPGPGAPREPNRGGALPKRQATGYVRPQVGPGGPTVAGDIERKKPRSRPGPDPVGPERQVVGNRPRQRKARRHPVPGPGVAEGRLAHQAERGKGAVLRTLGTKRTDHLATGPDLHNLHLVNPRSRKPQGEGRPFAGTEIQTVELEHLPLAGKPEQKSVGAVAPVFHPGLHER